MDSTTLDGIVEEVNTRLELLAQDWGFAVPQVTRGVVRVVLEAAQHAPSIQVEMTLANPARPRVPGEPETGPGRGVVLAGTYSYDWQDVMDEMHRLMRAGLSVTQNGWDKNRSDKFPTSSGVKTRYRCNWSDIQKAANDSMPVESSAAEVEEVAAQSPAMFPGGVRVAGTNGNGNGNGVGH